MELVVTIAVIAIALAIAIPNVSIWLVRTRIQSAAGKLQQDVQWAKGYAIRSGYPVAVSVQNTPNACAWSISPLTPQTVSQHIPQMNAVHYAGQYPNTPCQAQPAPAAAITFSVTPSGMVTDSTGAVTSAAVLFQSGAHPAEYGYWLVRIGGAGDVRSCAASLQNGVYACNMQ